jgi:hypothetical protein
MRALELGLVDKFVEVAPVGRPGHRSVCGCKKSLEGVPLLILLLNILIEPLIYELYIIMIFSLFQVRTTFLLNGIYIDRSKY